MDSQPVAPLVTLGPTDECVERYSGRVLGVHALLAGLVPLPSRLTGPRCFRYLFVRRGTKTEREFRRAPKTALGNGPEFAGELLTQPIQHELAGCADRQFILVRFQRL